MTARAPAVGAILLVIGAALTASYTLHGSLVHLAAGLVAVLAAYVSAPSRATLAFSTGVALLVTARLIRYAGPLRTLEASEWMLLAAQFLGSFALFNDDNCLYSIC